LRGAWPTTKRGSWVGSCKGSLTEADAYPKESPLSGYHKLFNTQRHVSLVEELKELGIPAAGFNQWWVPTVEFTGGAGVTIGFLAPLAALGLLVIILVAIATSGRHADHRRLGRRRTV
jgi:hypothetical protein